MRSLLKVPFLVGALACAVIGSNAQNVNTEMAGSDIVASKFTRPSLSVATVKFTNSVTMSSELLVNQIPERFDKNASKSSPIVINASVVQPYYGDDKEQLVANRLAMKTNKTELDPLVIEAVNKSRIANEILDKLFIVNGKASLDNLLERAKMTKTDKEVNTESEMSLEDQFARDFATVKNQLKMLYVVVFSQYDKTPFETDKLEGFKATGAYWVLKLDLPEDFESSASANWNNFKNYLSSSSFTWSLASTQVNVATSANAKPQVFKPSGNELQDAIAKKAIDAANAVIEKNRKSPEELIAGIQTQLYATQDYQATKAIVDFQPRVPLLSTKPIRGKVGKKEDLSKGQRWALRETVEKNGKAIQVHRGFVRADSIVDNRGVATGNTKPSTFYQIQGKKPEPGMLMVWQDDLGIIIRAAYMQKLMPSENYNSGYPSIQLGYLVKPVKGLYAGLEIQIDNDKSVEDFIGTSDEYSSTMALVGINIGYQLHTSRNSQLRVEGGFLYGSSDADLSDDYDFGYMYLVPQGSASLNFNVGKSMQLNITAGYRALLAVPDPASTAQGEATPFVGGGLTYNL